MNRLRTLLIAAPLLALGCADETTLDDPGVLESQVQDTELMYLRDRDAVRDAFSTGAATLTPTRSFRVAEFMVTLDEEDAAGIEFAVFAEGAWSDWYPFETGGEGRFRQGLIESDVPAQAVALRGDDGRIEFVRVEFFAEQPPEHAHDGFDDDRPFAEGHDDETRPMSAAEAEKAARAGRWTLPSNMVSVSADQYVAYESAPAWNGGRNCGGSLLAGTRELGEYLVANFAGARYYQGYNCRQIRGSSGMSMHGTGRALDIFVPMQGTQADNDLGDPIAHWLMQNAERIGVQLIIWDRSIWSAGRSSNKHRQYTGEHPHNDHLHIEFTAAAAARRTPFFTGGPAVNPGNPPPAGGAACSSATLGRNVPNGEAVQMAYESCGGTCKWAVCRDGSWQCSEPAAGAVQHAHAQCAPAQPQYAACNSQTLGRAVPHGQSVQMAYESCGGTCNWAICNNGSWSCEGSNPTGAVKHDHAQCAAPAGAACHSSTLGRSVPHGDRVQMAYAACANQRTCNWAVCDDGAWTCTSASGSGQDWPHQLCR
ncbi:MAG: hypothetical protein H6701_03820 [Myxococcales bacterium]|nr:hypothetical protein [Myxococcales bacterium]